MLADPTGGRLQVPKKQVDFTKATDLVCKCGNDIFMPVMKFKTLSALVSPTGKEALIPIEVYICSACGAIPQELDFNG